MEPTHPVGVQSVVYQHLPFSDALAELDEVGVEYLELNDVHCAATDDDATVEAAADAIDEAGVSLLGHGVVDLDDTGQAREHVAFADRLGAEYLTVNYPPERDDVTAELCDLAEAFGVDVAIHNYSSVHHDDLSQVFSSIADVLSVLDRHDHPRLGVCLDTGHFLVEDVSPAAAVRDLGERIRAVHLKDTSEAEIEDLPGAGRLDVSSVVGLLDEHGAGDVPLVVEYELPPERTTPALGEALANVEAALDGEGQ